MSGDDETRNDPGAPPPGQLDPDQEPEYQPDDPDIEGDDGSGEPQ